MIYETSLSKALSINICLVFVFLLAGCDTKVQEKTALLRQVKSMTIVEDSGVHKQSFSGRLHSTAEVSFSFKVSGTIKALPVKKGDRVKKGDILAKLDASDYELKVEKAQAALAQSEATQRRAKANYDRIKRLYEAGNTARNDLDSARAEAETAKAQVQASHKALEIAKKNLSYTTLTADDSCAIALVDPEVGENVNSGVQIVFATCGDDLEVKLNIPESVITYIKKGMPARVAFTVIPDKKFNGQVTEVGVSSIGSGTTFPVSVLITDADQSKLKAGLSADVFFMIDAKRNHGSAAAVIVPPFAVGEDDQGRFVYVIKSKTKNVFTVHRSTVQVGNVLQAGIEITSGLSPGMRIVVAGVSVLRDGMEVALSDE